MREKKTGYVLYGNKLNGIGKSIQLAGITLLAFLAFAAFAIRAPEAEAQSSYYTNRCAPCHSGSTTQSTCNGCHQHGARNLAAATNKTTYAPGEALTVTFTGGQRTGWIRAILYLNNQEVARSSGATGEGGGSGFPTTFSTTAPSTPGTYTYQAAWFGNTTNSGPSNPTHGEVRVSSNSFTVAAADTTPPTVSSTSPANNATDVAAGAAVTATFSEAVAPASVTASSFTLSGGVTGTISVNGATATFTPSAPLSNGTTYTATITTDITDVAGNHLAANRTWTFTTTAAADTIPPLVNSVSPSDTQAGVPANVVLTVTFSEAVDVPAGSLTLSDGTGSVPGTISVNGTTVTFTPSAILSDNTTYTATLTTAVTDLAGNHLANNYSSTFTTSTSSTPPVLDLGSSGGGGCAMARSGGDVRDIAGAYGFLILSALLIAIRGRMRRREK